MVDMATALNRSLFGDIYATIGSTNDVAAMPSLHAAYPCLMAVMFWPVSRRLGLLGLVYSLLMSLALVYLAEHYVWIFWRARSALASRRGVHTR